MFVGTSVCIKEWLQFLDSKQHSRSVAGPLLEVLDENDDGCVGKRDEK